MKESVTHTGSPTGSPASGNKPRPAKSPFLARAIAGEAGVLLLELAGNESALQADRRELVRDTGAREVDAALTERLREIQGGTLHTAGLRLRLSSLPSRLGDVAERLAQDGGAVLTFPARGLLYAHFPLPPAEDEGDRSAAAFEEWQQIGRVARAFADWILWIVVAAEPLALRSVTFGTLTSKSSVYVPSATVMSSASATTSRACWIVAKASAGSWPVLPSSPVVPLTYHAASRSLRSRGSKRPDGSAPASGALLSPLLSLVLRKCSLMVILSLKDVQNVRSTNSVSHTQHVLTE